ncbi:MAG: hypothetical protein ACMXX7_01005 [Candidatus Woesearchaeota archaeon]
MNVLNITFNEINASKKANPRGQVNVSNNIKVVDLKEAKLSLEKDKKALQIDFEYTTKYEPDFGTISLKGTSIVLDDEKTSSALIEKWSKDKKLEKEHAAKILNPVMNKAVLETILIARELDLPAPLPLPSIKTNN